MKALLKTAALGLSAALSLTACGGAGDEGDGKTITFVAAEYSTNTEPYWKDLIAKFEKANPGLKVDLQVVNWDDIDSQRQGARRHQARARARCIHFARAPQGQDGYILPAVVQGTLGRRSAHGRADSNWAATRRIVGSSCSRPTSCTASGNRSEPNPEGTDAAGLPVTFQSAV